MLSNLDIGGRALGDGRVEEGQHRLDVVARARPRVGAKQSSRKRRLGDNQLGRRRHFRLQSLRPGLASLQRDGQLRWWPISSARSAGRTASNKLLRGCVSGAGIANCQAGTAPNRCPLQLPVGHQRRPPVTDQPPPGFCSYCACGTSKYCATYTARKLQSCLDRRAPLSYSVPFPPILRAEFSPIHSKASYRSRASRDSGQTGSTRCAAKIQPVNKGRPRDLRVPRSAGLGDVILQARGAAAVV